MLDANTPIQIVMTAERWNHVLAILTEAAVPHRVSDPILRDIRMQCMAAERPPGPRIAPEDHEPVAQPRLVAE
jgi:hypothetical protein